TVSGDAADDETRVARAERCGRKTEPLARAGAEILDEHVGAREQPIQDRPRLRMLQIERQRLLRSIQPDEVARQPLHPPVVRPGEAGAAGTLVLDRACAEVGELPRSERSGDRLFDRDDGDVVEGTRHQYDLGRPSTCSLMYARMRLVETGAT